MSLKTAFCWPVLLTCLALGLLGCSVQTPTVSVSPSPRPGEIPAFQSPLRSPQPVPTSAPDKGTVKGKLHTADLTGLFSGGSLRLAPLLASTTPERPLFVLTMETDPIAILQPDDTFVFANVPPNQYVLIYWTPAGSFMFSDPKNGYTMIVTVQADETVDLGEVSAAAQP